MFEFVGGNVNHSIIEYNLVKIKVCDIHGYVRIIRFCTIYRYTIYDVA